MAYKLFEGGKKLQGVLTDVKYVKLCIYQVCILNKIAHNLMP